MSDLQELDEPLVCPPFDSHPMTVRLNELETVAVAKAEQRYPDPVRNVVPLTGQDIEILKADLGYTRCAVCRGWFGPLEEQCPRCEIPRHETGF